MYYMVILKEKLRRLYKNDVESLSIIFISINSSGHEFKGVILVD